MPVPPDTSRKAPADWDDPAAWGPTKTFLYLTLTALLVGAALVALALLIFAPQRPERLLGPGLVAAVALVGAGLVQAGRIVSARWFLASGVWAAFTLVATFTGGVRAPVALGYPLLIIMCGWQIGDRAALLAAGATVLAVIGLAMAEMNQWLPGAPLYLPAMHASVLMVVCFLGAAMVVLLVKAYRNKLRQLHRSREDLRRHSGEVESSRATLQRAQSVARVGSWTFDLITNQLELSDETRRIFDIPEVRQGDMAAYLKRVYEGDREPLQAAWAAALRGADFDHEHRIVDGAQVRWIRQKAEFEAGPDGAPIRVLGIAQDITERKQADERIAELAFYDQLSGLPNRTLLLDRLKQVMAAGERNASYSALLFLDLDNFKTLNDTLGHDMGDLLLQQVANRLMGCVRAGDTVARLGGDEFVVMLTPLGTQQTEALGSAESVALKLLTALSDVFTLGEITYQSTSSIGVTLFQGDQAPIDELMRQADLAMYKSKAAGRNAVRFFDPAMEAAVMERAALEADLRLAMDGNHFLLHYQPQVTANGRLIGAEALLRFQHPQRGMVSPAQFIPLAEATGLILPLGQWVLETACRQLAIWAQVPNREHLVVAVNVSAHQIRQHDFVDQVLQTLQRTGARAQRLKLELTESLMVSNLTDTIDKMSQLQAAGVGFSLDDFGTGYSSLAYLRRLPLDQIKIDQAFVRGVQDDPQVAAIARTIITLGQSLGLNVIAEGVETTAERDFLLVAGCHAYQGYLFSRPLPVEEFERFSGPV